MPTRPRRRHRRDPVQIGPWILFCLLSSFLGLCVWMVANGTTGDAGGITTSTSNPCAPAVCFAGETGP